MVLPYAFCFRPDCGFKSLSLAYVVFWSGLLRPSSSQPLVYEKDEKWRKKGLVFRMCLNVEFNSTYRLLCLHACDFFTTKMLEKNLCTMFKVVVIKANKN